MWYFGETERQAQTALDKIKDENQEAIVQNMMFSSQMGQDIQQGQQGGQPPEQGAPEQPPTPQQEAPQQPQQKQPKEQAQQGAEQA